MTLMEESFDRAFNEPFCLPVTIQKGFVAFMDILGFSHIRKSKDGFRSTEENTAGVIFGMMNDALTEKDELIRILDPRYMMDDSESENYKFNKGEYETLKRDQSLIRDNISISYVSDSFVCLANIGEKDRNASSFVTTAFFTLISSIATTMFKNGLPLRGGVSFGKYVANAPANKRPTAFLGEALIKAHAVEMTGCSASVILDELAEEKCKELYMPWRYEKSIYDWMHLCIADVAQKAHGRSGTAAINKRMCVNIQSTYLYQDDYRHHVEYFFSQHGKDISEEEVASKIAYTAKFLQSRAVVPEIYRGNRSLR